MSNIISKDGINVLSLFDGISTGRLVLDKLEIKVNNYFASEIDTYAMEISKKNWNDITYIGDITKIDIKTLPKIDLILAGSPCQGFSNQGKHLNFEDPRSKLFFNFVDILNWIKENNNPNVVFLLENVKMKKEWEDIITSYIGVEPICINSKLLSAQNRPRLYWTNLKVEDVEDSNIVLRDIIEEVDTSNYIPYQGLLIDPTISEKSRNLIKVVDKEVRIKQAVKIGYIVAKDGDGINLTFPTSKIRRGRVIKGKSSTLDCSCDLCVYYDNIIRKFTITEIEKLQTLPVNYTNGVSERKRKHAIGNGWTVNVIVHILKSLKSVY